MAIIRGLSYGFCTKRRCTGLATDNVSHSDQTDGTHMGHKVCCYKVLSLFQCHSGQTYYLGRNRRVVGARIVEEGVLSLRSGSCYVAKLLRRVARAGRIWPGASEAQSPGPVLLINKPRRSERSGDSPWLEFLDPSFSGGGVSLAPG